jgi:hypothetical protein
MGLYTESLVETYCDLQQAWLIADCGDIFPVHPKEQNSLGDLTDSPFHYQSYEIAAFIAGMRNYFHVPSLAEDRTLPSDHESIESHEGFGAVPCMVSRYPDDFIEEKSNSWVLLSELLAFDYDKTFEDRRYQGAGLNGSVEVGNGEVITFKEHLGDFFFEELAALEKVAQPDHVRIVFAFS